MRKESPLLLVIFSSFAIGIVASWERWGNPLVDSGRELNVPLRLVRGEALYSDVSYLYGPFSPYLNALLYRTFHPTLWAVWGRSIAATIVILALTYWLARQLSGRFTAALACVAVTWICALKPQGNYLLPYSFGGLDGCMFVLATTAASVQWLKFASWKWAVVAGTLASLAILSKTELGIAALCVGIVTALLAGYRRTRSVWSGLVAFLLPALGIPILVFAWFAARVGWDTLAVDNHLFFGHIPWQLVYFNQVRFGFDRPWYSISLMVASLIRLISMGGLLASVAILIGRRRDRISGDAENSGIGGILLVLGISLAGLALTTLGVLDLGPLMPMPILLTILGTAGVIAYTRAIRQNRSEERTQAGIIIILTSSALACLPRILLRVSTGGALSSFLLPISIVLFVYMWLDIFPNLVPHLMARRVAKQLVSVVLVVSLIATAGTLCARYRDKFNYPLVTSRGTWRVSLEHGVTFQQALQFIEEHTSMDDTVTVLPEGTSLNFFSGRRNPLREEITTPGFLDVTGEEQAIERLRKAHTPVILLANRLTPQFGQEVFGRDYDRRLFSWIEENYRSCAIFGPRADPSLALGSSVFFIRAYCSRPAN